MGKEGGGGTGRERVCIKWVLGGGVPLKSLFFFFFFFFDFSAEDFLFLHPHVIGELWRVGGRLWEWGGGGRLWFGGEGGGGRGLCLIW